MGATGGRDTVIRGSEVERSTAGSVCRSTQRMHLIRWLTSRTVRKACELEDAVLKILNHQRDVLGANAVTAVEGALSEYRRVVRGGADRAAIEGQMVALEHVANKWLRPYPSHSLRENVLMLLEIAVLIVGSRAFLIQPMVIPTGSAQPTLWGVTFQDLRETPGGGIPSLPVRLWEKAMGSELLSCHGAGGPGGDGMGGQGDDGDTAGQAAAAADDGGTDHGVVSAG